jgi:hypothetical protein
VGLMGLRGSNGSSHDCRAAELTGGNERTAGADGAPALSSSPRTGEELASASVSGSRPANPSLSCRTSNTLAALDHRQ